MMNVLMTGMMVLMFSGAALAQSGSCGGMSIGAGASLNGFAPFSTDSPWNTDISAAPVDPSSSDIINFIGRSVKLHPDFGSGFFRSQMIGIPYQVVGSSQPKVPVLLGSFAGESDPGPMPIPAVALIEGYPNPGRGDRHVIVLDRDGCWLYELFRAAKNESGEWQAASAAVWDMTINAKRPYRWTSTDAAGLPVFAGLVRYDEVAAGAIKHALRFTVPRTRRAFVSPASHWASRITDPPAPPIGTRLRLKASFDLSGFPPEVRVILAALKKYGMILADNGSAIFLTGAPHPNWDNDSLRTLRRVTASDFEVVRMDTIYTGPNIPRGRSPIIDSFRANSVSTSNGQPVTLSWKIERSLYNIISPEVGPVRGNSVVVTPPATTTYTIYATNQYGRTVKSVTISVQ